MDGVLSFQRLSNHHHHRVPGKIRQGAYRWVCGSIRSRKVGCGRNIGKAEGRVAPSGETARGQRLQWIFCARHEQPYRSGYIYHTARPLESLSQVRVGKHGQVAVTEIESTSRYQWFEKNCPKLYQICIDTMKACPAVVRNIFDENGVDAFLGKDQHAKKLDVIP